MDRVQRLVALGGRIVRPEPVMTLPRSAADVLAGHVLFEIEAIDDRGLAPAQVLYVGVAQEMQRVFRTSKRRNPVTGATYPWLVPGSGVVNQYYFYCVDEDFGPVCVKFYGYSPIPAG
jgi:hypothetical protein